MIDELTLKMSRQHLQELIHGCQGFSLESNAACLEPDDDGDECEFLAECVDIRKQIQFAG